jgi:polyisoprenoid-binding protein YceI
MPGQDTRTPDMTTGPGDSRTHQVPAARKPRRRWLRWAAAGLAAAVVLAFAGTYAFVHFLPDPVPAPLALPKLHVGVAGTGPVRADGIWTASKGSLAGYRVREEFIGPGNSIVGRTSAVTGKAVIARNEVTTASFRIDLTTVTASGKAQSQLAKILDTVGFPEATVTLTKPILTGAGLVPNRTFRVQATGMLAMHGATHPVTFPATVRYSGSRLEAAGSIPVLFSNWNIRTPEFLENHGLLEFLLILRR